MIRFTVTWREGAQNQLANIWINAPDRNSVADAANEIDRILRHDPTKMATATAKGMYRLYVPPLYVLFAVRAGDRIVEIASVKRANPIPPAATSGNGKSAK